MRATLPFSMLLAFSIALVFCPAPVRAQRPAAPPARDPSLVVLRGSVESGRTNQLEFVADQDNLEDMSLSGVTGQDVMTLRGPILRDLARMHVQAQLASGTPPDRVRPLYIIIDPAGDWAHAWPWASISYRHDGRPVGPITTPLLVVGEKMDHSRLAFWATPESVESNRRITTLAAEFYARARDRAPAAAFPAGSSRPRADLVTDVLRPFRLLVNDQDEMDLERLAGQLSTERYAQWLRTAMVRDLDRRGLDGTALWAELERTSDLNEQVREGQRRATENEVARTIAHELGHVIQFAALGLHGYRSGRGAAHMDGNRHTRTTLSTPEFAFVEGWAEGLANAVSGRPRSAASPNRIDYRDTAEVVLKRRNQTLAEHAVALLVGRGLAGPDRPLAIPPLGAAHDAFLAGLRDAALTRGMTVPEWERVLAAEARDPLASHLDGVADYVEALQARKGQKRERYDFLRSEDAVSHLIEGLYRRLDPSAREGLLETLARDKPSTLPEFLEAFLHARQDDRAAVYALLAELSEGILVTTAQADFIATMDRRGQALEIDLDRDGRVPGASANTRAPALFPAEPDPVRGRPDPLRWDGPSPSPLIANRSGSQGLVVRGPPDEESGGRGRARERGATPDVEDVNRR